MSVVLAVEYEDDDRRDELPQSLCALPIEEGGIETTVVEGNSDSSSSGRFKHFGHPISGGTRGKDDSYTKCSDCYVRLWKDTVMDTIHCPKCGLILQLGNGTAFHDQKGGVNGGRSGLQKITPKNRLKYDNSGVTRLHGGYESGYYGDGEYEFGSLDDSLLDETY